MAMHRLTSVSIGVPNVAETAAYYEEFGLTRLDDSRFATADGGEQLRLVPSPRRRLAALGVIFRQIPDAVAAVDAGTGVRVVLRVADPIAQTPVPAAAQNAPGR